MKYLVMETHPAYAVVLDNEGRFLKAANLHYQVGDTVERIVELRPPREKTASLWKPLVGLTGLAACLCLVFFGYYQPNFTPYGALRMQINPDVELTLSRTDRVLELESLNTDGQALISGYSFDGKDRKEVTEELVQRAIDRGYLSDGETVAITISSADGEWQARETQDAQKDLEARYGDAIVIQIGPLSQEPPQTEVVIPVTPSPPDPVADPSPIIPSDEEDDGDWREDWDDDWDGDPIGSDYPGDSDDWDDDDGDRYDDDDDWEGDDDGDDGDGDEWDDEDEDSRDDDD